MNTRGIFNSLKITQESGMSGILDISGCNHALDTKLSLYIRQLTENKESIKHTVQHMVDLFSICKGSIFFTGVGKSGHIARKSVATWQSLGIRCHFLHPQDCFHGDMGVLRPGDTVLYISNSGKTDELISLSAHLQSYSIHQVSLTNDTSAQPELNVNHRFKICPECTIQEADIYSLVPSISSMLFMTVLDLVGICLAEKNNYSSDDFKKNHPSGVLGANKK